MMSTDNNLLHSDLTEHIIGSAYDVYNALGQGFLEKVYENALAIKLRKIALRVEQQAPVNVYFEGERIGEYFADLLVDNKVIIELKAVSQLSNIHEVQLINYLKATDLKVGLLINFGEKIKIIRRVA